MLDSMNKMSRFFYRPATGLLIIRIVIGAVFVHHGWEKLLNESMPLGLMAHIGFAPFWAYVITWVEIAGGLMLIFGVLARAAGVALAFAMLIALRFVALPGRGFAGSELEFLLMFGSLGIAFTGAGRYRFMHLFEHDHLETREVHQG